MKCPKCEAELASGAIMCPKCGSPVREQEKAPEAAKPKLKFAYIAAAVLALIIILGLVALFAFKGQPIAQTGKTVANSGPAITNTPPPAHGGPAITNTPPTTAPQPPVSSSPAKAAVPPEVTDYLKFLKAVEESRQALLKDTTRALQMSAGTAQAQSMIDMIDNAMDDSPKADKPKKADAVQNELDKQIGNWSTLVQQFDRKPAPQQCTDLAANYRLVLTNEAGSMSKILNVVKTTDWSNLQSIQKSLTELQNMKNDPNLQGNIDKAVETSDGKLAEVCTKFGITKPFDVKKEQGGGSIIGVGG